MSEPPRKQCISTTRRYKPARNGSNPGSVTDCGLVKVGTAHLPHGCFGGFQDCFTIHDQFRLPERPTAKTCLTLVRQSLFSCTAQPLSQTVPLDSRRGILVSGKVHQGRSRASRMNRPCFDTAFLLDMKNATRFSSRIGVCLSRLHVRSCVVRIGPSRQRPLGEPEECVWQTLWVLGVLTRPASWAAVTAGVQVSCQKEPCTMRPPVSGVHSSPLPPRLQRGELFYRGRRQEDGSPPCLGLDWPNIQAWIPSRFHALSIHTVAG